MSPAKRAAKASAEPPSKTSTDAAPLAAYNAKRDFTLTKEPSGKVPARKAGKALAFVIQKHAASHLHFDLRLESDGVMKSWAVPKGPSVDTSVKRLAMEVEDHPIAYNTFEGTIPEGEYGGGTVMLWDRGTYTPDELQPGESDEDAVRRALKAGKLAFTFHGARLQGSFALVRTRRGEERSQWLLIKHHDEFAKEGHDIVAEVMTSVETNRTITQIAAGDNAVLEQAESTGAIEPMVASRGNLPLAEGEYAVEAAVEGTRVLAFLTHGTVQVMRSVKGKTSSEPVSLDDVPDVQAALLRLARKRNGALVLDGVLEADLLVLFDLLIEDDELLVNEPWIERRTRLDEALINSEPRTQSGVQRLRLNEWVASDADGIADAARAIDANDIIAKRVDAPYESGTSKAWTHVRISNPSQTQS